MLYTNFITQPLNLSHFIPAIEKDGKWIVLEEPKFNTENEYDEYERNLFCSKLEEYQTALDNVVFKLNEVEKLQIKYWLEIYETIEDLIPYNLEVNETIIKKFGL